MSKNKFNNTPVSSDTLPPIPDVYDTIFAEGEVQSRDLDTAEYIKFYYDNVIGNECLIFKAFPAMGDERSNILGEVDHRFPGYPTDATVFRVNDGYTDIVVALPFNFMPGGFKETWWYVVYNQGGQPIALAPMLPHEAMAHIRMFTRVFCRYPCVFFVNGTLCYDDVDFDEQFDLGWFPLTPEDQEGTHHE